MNQKLLLCLVASVVVLGGCTGQLDFKTSDVSNQNVALSSFSSRTADTERSIISKNANTNKSALAPLPPEKKHIASFDREDCSLKRCTKVTQQIFMNSKTENVHVAPKGYSFLEVDALPKDYLLVIKGNDVFTYKPSTGKITPFTYDDSKKQMTLAKDEAIYAKEAFNEPGKYLLLVFKMTLVKNEAWSFSQTEPKEFALYDSKKDVLTSVKTENIKNLFITNQESGSYLSNSPFLFDGKKNQIIVWGGMNRFFWDGPIGEPTANLGELFIASLDGKKKELVSKDQYIIPGNNGSFFIFDTDVISDVSYHSALLNRLTNITYRDFSVTPVKGEKYTMSKQVQKYFAEVSGPNDPNLVFDYGFAGFERKGDTLIWHGFWTNSLEFTVGKGNVLETVKLIQE